MGGDEARKLETRVFLGRVERGSYRVEIHKIGVERGVSWEDAYAVWKDHHEEEVPIVRIFVLPLFIISEPCFL